MLTYPDRPKPLRVVYCPLGSERLTALTEHALNCRQYPLDALSSVDPPAVAPASVVIDERGNVYLRSGGYPVGGGVLLHGSLVRNARPSWKGVAIDRLAGAPAAGVAR